MTKFQISQSINYYDHNLLESHQELDVFLRDIHCNYPDFSQAQIISFSQQIDRIDPLEFLATIVQPDQLYLYWENQRQAEAIISYGTIKCLKINSSERFKRSQEFIDKCLHETITLGELQLPGSGPHFFCSFSFFAEQKKSANFPSATIFLPELHIYCQKDSSVLVVNAPWSEYQQLPEKIASIKRKIQKLQPIHYTFNNNPKTIQNKAQQFQQSVTSALNSIKAKKFSKIVLAHAVDIIAEQPFNLIKSLANLRQDYPDCYTFSLSNGRQEHFIGASPERLITINNKQLITDAIAGSAPRGTTQTEDTNIAQSLLNNEKERREHEAVSKFIHQRLCELGLDPQVMPIELLQLANIQHLWTAIYAQLPHQLHPLDIVAQLHPTPAVAGVPTEIACREIRRYECFDRSLYAAPIGWIDYRGNSKFIVGIRSALLQGNRVRLYGGAGIVAGSIPAREYAEVQLKLQSLQRALV
ncbi:isochorismate synthase MenF [Gloeocapsa sp. PCC 73106]|uniref:isochorismate synthase n=1 Tax=Gloeocapsa sp. PCC 73106 TaxID=102232 RepID=UPI000300EF73|nr:isochorismate synthase [Gloeocapsa sp. PCC 73106]